AAVAAAALLITGGTPSSDIQSDRGFDSGRSDLIEGGLELAEERPLAGYGAGSFGAAFVAEIDPQARSAISHSEPITVAAEQGAIGVVVYAGLLLIAFVTVLGRGAGTSLPRTATAACFVAMFVHSLGYAGFAIDPATWALLGLGIALRRDPPEPSATIPA
ncbi:MAG: O-antigen ligase family protein, partial [Solirubrobacterales bacterium]